MKVVHSVRAAIAVGAIAIGVALPTASFAYDHEQGSAHERQISPEERTQWIKTQLDHEASMLEIKASQQDAWEAYASATTSMMSEIGSHKPGAADLDAAAMVRDQANHLAAMAQELSKLADATATLQGVLTPEQRKVLDRITRMHSQFHEGHHHAVWGEKSGMQSGPESCMAHSSGGHDGRSAKDAKMDATKEPKKSVKSPGAS